ncbi:MAG TPA: PilW family protein [Woeseiaceae bacterium]|jgi:type IV pilus assembly protein PilW|nr:PilW family protein [Woeseiaceae bacterium]
MIKRRQQQLGLTLVELMVALAIGSFLMIGAVQIYNQSRQAFVVNESIARVQETATFAMDTIEADLRMASNWGMTSRALSIDGRSIIGDPNPMGLPEPNECGDGWALNIGMAVDGENNGYSLACAAEPAAVGNSDVLTVRRASVDPAPMLQAGRLQIQTTRIQGEIFADGAIPAEFTPVDSSTHNLFVNSYYVANNSELIPGVPTLRRKTLAFVGGVQTIEDQEVAPGVENLQVQFGVDVNDDNTVDRYVNPGDGVYDPNDGAYIPGARVITARIWLVVRGVTAETGIQQVRSFDPGDVNLGTPNDAYRRMQVSKTILLRNART